MEKLSTDIFLEFLHSVTIRLHFDALRIGFRFYFCSKLLLELLSQFWSLGFDLLYRLDLRGLLFDGSDLSFRDNSTVNIILLRLVFLSEKYSRAFQIFLELN